jgi:hypothetical protein
MAEVFELAEVNVFYGGTGLAGARTSMNALAPLQGISTYRPMAERAVRSFVWRHEGRACRVRVVSDYRGMYYIKSLREALTHPDEQTRVCCKLASEFLPLAQGVVFVADSQALRAEANVERLERTIDDLQAAGRRVDEVPFVFQQGRGVHEVFAALMAMIDERR